MAGFPRTARPRRRRPFPPRRSSPLASRPGARSGPPAGAAAPPQLFHTAPLHSISREPAEGAGGRRRGGAPRPARPARPGLAVSRDRCLFSRSCAWWLRRQLWASKSSARGDHATHVAPRPLPAAAPRGALAAISGPARPPAAVVARLVRHTPTSRPRAARDAPGAGRGRFPLGRAPRAGRPAPSGARSPWRPARPPGRAPVPARRRRAARGPPADRASAAPAPPRASQAP